MAKKLLLFLVSICVVIVFFLIFNGKRGFEKNIIIQRGTNLNKLAFLLEEEKIIKYPLIFKLAIKITGGEKKIRAGEFKFYEGMSIKDAIDTIYNNKPILHQVTIPEGWNIKEIADFLEKNGLVKKESFLSLAFSKESAQKYLKFSAPSLEGFLFPDTYLFSKVDGEEKIIEIMVNHFFSKYKAIHEKRANELGFGTLKLITLASIIEKETGAQGERKLISSVFHNRLKKNMRLQSDPTTIYGINDFDGNLTKIHLQTYTPYNTYKIKGLPPGPIANPGWASIEAALYPANTDYLYFVSNNSGSHIFSKNYSDHHKSVWKHQIRRTNASNAYKHPRNSKSRKKKH